MLGRFEVRVLESLFGEVEVTARADQPGQDATVLTPRGRIENATEDHALRRVALRAAGESQSTHRRLMGFSRPT